MDNIRQVVRVKHPRTYHMHKSPGVASDDKVITSYDGFVGHDVVITEKMDGECTTLYDDYYVHARSIDGVPHESQDYVRGFLAGIAHTLPRGWRLTGENLYALHSIAYENLTSYFMGYFLWNSDNVALSWDETLEWFELIGVTPVPTLYRGPFDEHVLDEIASSIDITTQEGFVVRVAESIPYDDFCTKVMKWVRAGHVQSPVHWRSQVVTPNKLRS